MVSPSTTTLGLPEHPDDGVNPWLLWAKWEGHHNPPSYHPLLCHLIDVGMVTHLLWENVVSPSLRRRLADALGMEESEAGRWIAFWGAMHDIGKASPTFQLQRRGDTFFSQLQKSGFRWHPNAETQKTPHGMVSDIVLREILVERGMKSPIACSIADGIGGHHGIFASPRERQAQGSQAIGKGAWVAYRTALTQALATYFMLPAPPTVETLSAPHALTIAGLVSVADWIGSNTTYFKHAALDAANVPSIDLMEYGAQSRTAAARALDELGWCGWSAPKTARSFKELFPLITEPRPLQTAVEQLLPQLSGPGLVVIEAPMGEGKTETAFLLQEHWAATLQQAGAYLGLPTQATSNSMFLRFAEFLKGRYADEKVNLQLLHGHAALSGLFQQLQHTHNRVFEPHGIFGETELDGAPANIVAAQWFSARKRGLLAPFGVGTIDQALLTVLPTKHGFVRIYGLAAKTVIIDEVHAYDTYMTTLLEQLLRWLGALGTSVAVLSATLPRSRRDALLAAYGQGADWMSVEPQTEASYPRISWITADICDAKPIASAKRSHPNIRLRWVEGTLPAMSNMPFELGEQLREALADGGCAAVICNTVRRAQQMYEALKHYFPGSAADGSGELDLFHARLLFRDRDAREERVLRRFGKHATDRPLRAVLIATQVIEQSLDLDFDLLITDHAPADLVLQRAGRVWRHERAWRPSSLTQPEVWICRPDVLSDGVPRFERGSTYVYDGHVLLRSWLVLRDRTSIHIPDDIEGIVETVYRDEEALADLIPALQATWEETRQQQQEETDDERKQAHFVYIKQPSFKGPFATLIGTAREEDAPELHPAHQARTRLIEETVSVICVDGTDDAPHLDGVPIKRSHTPTVVQSKHLLERSITINHRGVIRELLARKIPSGWAKSSLLRNYRLLAFSVDGTTTVGDYRIVLDPERGLIIGGDRDHTDI